MDKLARSITKWTKACDKRLNRLISYIHHTSEYKQYCHVGNTAKQCRLGLFQDSDFAGDLEDSKSTSGGTLCIFGSHAFAPISWLCKKQTSVSHSTTESQIISLDAGLRMVGIPALDLWDLIVTVLHGNTHLERVAWSVVLYCSNRASICSHALILLSPSRWIVMTGWRTSISLHPFVQTRGSLLYTCISLHLVFQTRLDCNSLFGNKHQSHVWSNTFGLWFLVCAHTSDSSPLSKLVWFVAVCL